MNKLANGFGHFGENRKTPSIVGKIRDTINSSTRIANGVLKNPRTNDNHIHQNGAANGVQHLLQNGVSHLGNGIAPGANRVGPAPSPNFAQNPKESVRKMFNEVNGYHEDLHM